MPTLLRREPQLPFDASPPLRLLRARWLRFTLLALALAAALLFALGLWLVRQAEPLVRASLIGSLKQRFHSRVELDSFHFTLHNPSLTGGTAIARIDGLRIWLPQPDPVAAADPLLSTPWINIQHLRFTASLSFLRGGPLLLRDVQVEGVRLLIPPKDYRRRITGSNSARPLSESSPASSVGMKTEPARPELLHPPRIQVDQIDCRDVFLEMEREPARSDAGDSVHPAKPSAATALYSSATQPSGRLPAGQSLPKRLTKSAQVSLQPAKQPLQFQISSLLLTPHRDGGLIGFTLQMTNPHPTGLIVATGLLGPWQATQPDAKRDSNASFDPGALPLSGNYRFEHADLGSFRGIAGTLASTGNFTGILHQVQISGQISTPDFRLTRHGVVPPESIGLPLAAHFSATVDGTNGNTVLDSVEATLGHTPLRASGQILRVAEIGPAAPRIGHDLQLHIRVDRGQIADLLQVVTASSSPLVTGFVTLTDDLHLPPGNDSFRERLMLDGHFDATDVHFTSPRVERDLEQLSLRGQGHPEALRNGSSVTVASTMAGDFTLDSGVLNLPDLAYTVPGAQIRLRGTYTLEGGALDFSGDARTQATLSQLVGGWKGVLLSPMNHFLSKNGAGTDIPVHLTGTRAEPRLTIDFSRLGKSEQPSAPNTPKP